jgi:hypothetical protein
MTKPTQGKGYGEVCAQMCAIGIRSGFLFLACAGSGSTISPVVLPVVLLGAF